MFSKNTKVIELSSFDFTGKVINKKPIGDRKGMIFFGAPWCGYCVKTAPIYEKTADYIGKSYNFYYINCDKYPNISKTFNIQGFPTIMYVDKLGSPYKKYQSERTMTGFLDSICLETSICKKY